MAKARFKHRAIEVGETTMISLCESCQHMPSGKVPQSNHDKTTGVPERPSLYCIKKAFFPDVNYSNSGKPFYDVARCDSYERYIPQEQQEKYRDPEIKRYDGEKQ